MPTRSEWPELMKGIAEERIGLSVRKNANYAGDEDAFSNFNLIEQVTHGKVTRETGIFVRLCDKVARLGNVLFGVPDQVGESVEDTVKDLGNYADILLQAWREKHCYIDAPPTAGLDPGRPDKEETPIPISRTGHLASFFNKKK